MQAATTADRQIIFSGTVHDGMTRTDVHYHDDRPHHQNMNRDKPEIKTTVIIHDEEIIIMTPGMDMTEETELSDGGPTDPLGGPLPLPEITLLHSLDLT
jgi:hypothetical protein